MSYQSEVQQMISLIKEASRKVILPRFGNVKGVAKERFPSFEELVTEADDAGSDYILNRIRKDFPGSYSEEKITKDRFDHDLIWQIDPVDDTSEFSAGYAHGYSCNAALLKKTKGIYQPVAGIIYLPGEDKLLSNDGIETRLIVGGVEQELTPGKNDVVKGCIRKVDPSPELARFYQELGAKLEVDVEVKDAYGAGTLVTDMVQGRLNLVIFNYDYTKEWDTSMAEPIIRSLGGFLCDFEGNDITYNRNDHFNRGGVVFSIVFNKNQIIPIIPKDLLVKRI